MGISQTAANPIMVPLPGNRAAAFSYILVDEVLRNKEVVVEKDIARAPITKNQGRLKNFLIFKRIVFLGV